ncbi:unnamed protein product [Symbiodinium sp. CCMP2456]|nr:unnamed protein product [Symbiodinium sp. CCMP2456]
MFVSVFRRLPQISRAAACSPSSSLLHRHFPDQLAIESTAPPQKYLSRLADLVQEAQHSRSCAGSRSKSPHRTGDECRGMPCASRQYHRTLRGNASVLVCAARRRSREKGWDSSLDRDDIFQMLLEQGGRCNYSGVPMEILVPHSHWRMSLERLNNSEGYRRQNCALVAAEFNSGDFSRALGVKQADVEGSAQWSAEKHRFVSNACNLIVDLEKLQQDVVDAFRKPFLSGMPSRSSYRRAYSRTLRSRSKSLIYSAHARSRMRDEDCELEYTDILRMLLQQRGRCFYSGVPLQYERPHTDWVMSLERLDNSIGYVKGNCVLIASEFNTPDRSKTAKWEVRGSSQWSLAKVMHVWGRAGFL